MTPPEDTIPNTHGAVHVFAVPPQTAQLLANDPAALAAALGVAEIDPTAATVFADSALDGLGLPGYLIEGHGIAAEVIEGDRALLTDLTGDIAVIPAHALPEGTDSLHLAADLRFIATYSEARPAPAFTPLPSDSAKGTLAADAPPTVTPKGPGLLLLLLLAIPLLLALVLFWVKT